MTAVWLAAARPRTLTLALATIALGGFLAAADGQFRPLIFLLTLLTAVLLQILSNLANDYGDSHHGADSATRAGPRRAVQSGAISAETMRRAMVVTAGLALVTGLALVWLAFGAGALPLLALFLALGAAAVWAALAYTTGERPYGYAGLGDLFVLVFFGWVGVAGTYVVLAGSLATAVLLPATAAGLFAVAVLNVNNIRDIDSDRAAGKRSIPVRLGPHRARLYHAALIIGGLLASTLYVLLNGATAWQWLYLLAAPLLLNHLRQVWPATTAAELDPLLKQMSVAALAFAVLFGLGQYLAALG